MPTLYFKNRGVDESPMRCPIGEYGAFGQAIAGQFVALICGCCHSRAGHARHLRGGITVQFDLHVVYLCYIKWLSGKGDFDYATR